LASCAVTKCRSLPWPGVSTSRNCRDRACDGSPSERYFEDAAVLDSGSAHEAERGVCERCVALGLPRSSCVR
jgi:hypothetical protein